MSTFSKQAAEARTNAIEAAKRMALKPRLLRHPEVRAAFNRVPAALRKDATLALSTYSNTVSIYMRIDNLDSFKDKQLTNVLEKFLEWNATTSEYCHSMPNKDFRFDKRFYDDKVGEFEISIAVYAYVNADSPLCRIVVTGVTEEIVRKEVKQIVCA